MQSNTNTEYCLTAELNEQIPSCELKSRSADQETGCPVSKPNVRSNIYSKELLEGPVLRQITQSPCTQFLQGHCNIVLPYVPVTRVVKVSPLILLYVIHRSTTWCSVSKEAVPLQAWSSLDGSRKLRFPDSGCQP